MNTKHDTNAIREIGRLPHRVALMLLCVVFPLIWVGGLVTTYDAGMAVPDWPNTYNYNMFAYPVRDWFFGPWDLFVEHGHRLLGTLSGILAIVLVAVSFWKDSRRWFSWVTVGVLLLVILQGLLGGARVVLDERLIAQIHGTLGPAFFAVVGVVVVFSGRWWRQQEEEEQRRPGNYCGLMMGLTATIFLASFAQLAIGAAIRHVSENSSPSYFSWMVLLHLCLAAVITMLVGFQFALSRLKIGKRWGFRGTSFFLAFLVLIQVALGLATWIAKFGWPAWLDGYAASAHFVVAEKSFWQMNLITAHVAVGSLILATSAILTTKLVRTMYPPEQRDLASVVSNDERAKHVTSTQTIK